MSAPTTRRILPFPSSNLYPVSCSTHGHNNPGYIMCLCIAKSISAVHSVTHPTAQTMGIVVCGRVEPHRKEEYVLMCGRCVREKGLDRMGGRVGL